jgi:hypothetical protein
MLLNRGLREREREREHFSTIGRNELPTQATKDRRYGSNGRVPVL